MRTTILTLTLLVAPLAVATTPTTATAVPPGALRGVWTSIDTDGSHQRMNIQGAGTTGRYAVRLVDDEATSACDGNPAALNGVGRLDGSDLEVTGVVTCKPGGRVLDGRISIGFTYSAADDTLTDEFGVEWSRG